MNDYDNFSINIMHRFYCQITMKVCLQGHNMISKNADLVVINMLFWIYY